MTRPKPPSFLSTASIAPFTWLTTSLSFISERLDQAIKGVLEAKWTSSRIERGKSENAVTFRPLFGKVDSVRNNFQQRWFCFKQYESRKFLYITNLSTLVCLYKTNFSTLVCLYITNLSTLVCLYITHLSTLVCLFKCCDAPVTDPIPDLQQIRTRIVMCQVIYNKNERKFPT